MFLVLVLLIELIIKFFFFEVVILKRLWFVEENVNLGKMEWCKEM